MLPQDVSYGRACSLFKALQDPDRSSSYHTGSAKGFHWRVGPEHGRAAINEGTPIFGRSAKIVSEWKLHEHAQPTDPARRDTVPGVSRKITFLSPQSVVISRCTVLFLCRLCLTNFNLKDHNGTVLPNLRIGDPPGHLLRSCFNPTHIVRRTQCRTSAKTFDTLPGNLAFDGAPPDGRCIRPPPPLPRCTTSIAIGAWILPPLQGLRL